MPKLILTLLLATLLLLAPTQARRKKPVLEEQQPVQEEKVTVVQSNHFSSETETSTNLEIGETTMDKPLVFLLQPNTAAEEQQLTKDFNMVTVTITSGNDKVTCSILNFYGLCTLPAVTHEKPTLSIECKEAPCDIRWQLVQPQTIEIDGKHELNHLVDVNKDKNHAILKVFCASPDLKAKVRTDLELYTNSKYQRIVATEGEVQYLFNNEEKGQYYLTTKNTAIEKCAEVTLQHSTDEVELKAEGVSFHDFISSREENEYLIKSAPETDLVVEMLAHSANMQPLTNTTGVLVKFVGVKDKKDVDIAYLTLNVDNEKEFIDFSAVFKKPSQTYDSYYIKMRGLTEEYLISTTTVIASDLVEVSFQEESYFDLKKGQTIEYLLKPLDKKDINIEQMNIENSNSSEFKVSRDSCPKEGCKFTVEALMSSQGYIYIGEDIKQKKATETVLIQFDKAISQKLREGEEKFYLYKMAKGTNVQLLINTPNAIVYLADKNKCPADKLKDCSEKQFSYHHPTIYEAKEATELALKVVALDSCKFTITALDSNKPYIELQDSQPFVYLMDDNEHELTFHFKLHQKEDTSFNVVAGMNELELFVFNQETLKEDTAKYAEESEYSLEGYVSYKKGDLTSKDFVIKVQKREEYRNKYVHFTLIASTQTGNLRLEPGNAHYETLKPEATRDYMFQVQAEKKMFLNFYTHNLQKIDLVATLSRTDEYGNKSATAEFGIDRQTDVINIALLTQKLCGEELSDCEIFIRLRNKMEVEADVTLTLMVRDVVVELKDGIWQTYDINEAASSAHFYFLPKHEKHSIALFYHSYNVDLKLTYQLWKSDDTSIPISEWPFPTNFHANDEVASKELFRPTRFIHIDNSELKKCWPDCVILLSLFPNQKDLETMEKKPTPFYNIYHNFKIMASNNLVEIPEKTKLDLVLNQGEEKFLLVDLKYFLSKESLVFFTYITMGSVSFKANLYTEKNPHCPSTEESASDFVLHGIETELSMDDVRKKLEDNEMENDKGPYLCILANAYVESKFSVEFVSETSNIRNLPIDTTTSVKMGRDETRLFQMNANYKFFVKIARTVGFPFISKKVCSPADDMEQCLEDFRTNDEKGEQLTSKIMAFEDKPCASCMLYVKVYSREEVQLSIHAQSIYAQIDLKEGQPLTDVVAANETNRYIITSTKNKEVILNIHVISGNVKVDLSDYLRVSVTKENTHGNNNIHIVVPSKDLKTEKTDSVAPIPYYMSAFAMSNFVNLHLTVTSQNASEPANFIITYSNGGQSTYLEDGLISEYTLMAKKEYKFLYNTPSYAEPIYLYISAPDALTLSNLRPKIYGLENEGDEDNRMELTPERPVFKKKTVDPTMLLHFTGKSHYRIEIDNKNAKDVILTIGINSREIVYLPLDHEFPFKIDPKEYIYLVVAISTPGYLKFTLSKCDASQPYIAYTDDYKEFEDEEFETEEQLTDELTYHNYIKVKKAGSVYFKVRASSNDTSLLTVKASFSTKKTEATPAKAGDRGSLQYQLLESNKAEITFSPVVCDSKCIGAFTYSAVISPSIGEIYAHLVCTAVSFDFGNSVSLRQPTIEPITAPRSSGDKITFQHMLGGDTEYVGVKAVNAKTGEVVHYSPVELINLSGKINKALETASQNNNPYWIIGVLVLVSVCWVLIAYRRYKRRQNYTPIGRGIGEEEED